DQVTVNVNARRIWNHTGITVRAGEAYKFRATGHWIAWFISHGPDGDPSQSWYMQSVQRWGRVKDANWFALIGAVNTDIATVFVIGANCIYEMTNSGERTWFANDIRCLYWNNCGQIEL